MPFKIPGSGDPGTWLKEGTWWSTGGFGRVPVEGTSFWVNPEDVYIPGIDGPPLTEGMTGILDPDVFPEDGDGAFPGDPTPIPIPFEGDIPMATDVFSQLQAEQERDPAFFETIFGEELGIPLRGRSVFERYLANRYSDIATSFALRQAPALGGGQALPPGQLPQTFRQFVRGRPGSLRELGLGGVVGQFRGLAPGAQREALQFLGGGQGVGGTDSLLQQLGEAELRQRVSPFLARGLAAREFGPAARRAFEITPTGQAGGSFFDFVRSRLGV